MKEIIRIVKDWFSRDHTRLALGIGIFSAGLAGYALGMLRDITETKVPLAINIVAPQERDLLPGILGDMTSENAIIPAQSDGIANKSAKCAFVGSKNSTLYHLPTCASARRIKDENRRCFVSAEDAVAKGYHPGCLK